MILDILQTRMSECSEDHDGDFQPCGINVKSLPAVMQGRVKALKNLQMDTVKVGLGNCFCRPGSKMQHLDFKSNDTYLL